VVYNIIAETTDYTELQPVDEPQKETKDENTSTDSLAPQEYLDILA